MPKIACSWVDLADNTDTLTWYEDTHIPSIVKKLGTSARNATPCEDDAFKEVAGINYQYMTLYDLPEDADADAQVQVQPATQDGSKITKSETRIFEQHSLWDGQEWIGGDAQMFMIVLWQPLHHVHDEFIHWVSTEFIPGMLDNPDVLRARIFKLDQAFHSEGAKTEPVDTEKMYQYMTVWEFGCEELPWEVIVYLGSSKGWRHYVEGGLLQWQMRQYRIDRIYPDLEDEAASTGSE
ncbi:hypothetical protein ACEQ8H_007515 [Pleosporales sp. CAS-2024a]